MTYEVIKVDFPNGEILDRQVEETAELSREERIELAAQLTAEVQLAVSEGKSIVFCTNELRKALSGFNDPALTELESAHILEKAEEIYFSLTTKLKEE